MHARRPAHRHHIATRAPSSSHNRPHALGRGAQRVIHQVCVTVCRGGLRVPQQGTDNRQRQTEAREDRCVGMP